MRAWEAKIARGRARRVLAREQWLRFVGGGRQCRELPLTTGIEDIVVEALADEDCVGEAEVNSEGYDGRNQTGPRGAKKICNVADKPDGEEEQRDALGGLEAIVFNELRNLVNKVMFPSASGDQLAGKFWDGPRACGERAGTYEEEDPRRERDGAEDATKGFPSSQLCGRRSSHAGPCSGDGQEGRLRQQVRILILH